MFSIGLFPTNCCSISAVGHYKYAFFLSSRRRNTVVACPTLLPPSLPPPTHLTAVSSKAASGARARPPDMPRPRFRSPRRQRLSGRPSAVNAFGAKHHCPFFTKLCSSKLRKLSLVLRVHPVLSHPSPSQRYLFPFHPYFHTQIIPRS